MMTLRCLVVALAFLVASASDSWGQSKQQTPPPGQAAQPNQNPKPYERGTETAPVVVKIIPPNESEEKTAADAKREEDKVANDRRLTKFTEYLFWATVALSVIAFLQLLVFGWQGVQLQRTVSASEKEFNATHRPKIRVKHVWLESDIWQGEPVTVKLTCVNNGTTVALLQEVGIKFLIVRNDRSLPQPKIDATYKAGGVQLIPGKNYEFPSYSDGTFLTANRNVDIQNRTHKLFCVGYVSYLDAAERMRITGFCRVLEFPQNSGIAHKDNSRFRKFDDPDYEYED